MRLIDADNYCKNICRCNDEKCDKEKCHIHSAPTAYDVDKIVEDLEKVMANNTQFENGFHFALEEVKRYGKVIAHE